MLIIVIIINKVRVSVSSNGHVPCASLTLELGVQLCFFFVGPSLNGVDIRNVKLYFRPQMLQPDT